MVREIGQRFSSSASPLFTFPYSLLALLCCCTALLLLPENPVSLEEMSSGYFPGYASPFCSLFVSSLKKKKKLAFFLMLLPGVIHNVSLFDKRGGEVRYLKCICIVGY